MSTLIRIMSEFPGYDVDGWELDGSTVMGSEITFHDSCITLQGRCFVDSGNTLEFHELLF